MLRRCGAQIVPALKILRHRRPGCPRKHGRTIASSFASGAIRKRVANASASAIAAALCRGHESVATHASEVGSAKAAATQGDLQSQIG